MDPRSLYVESNGKVTQKICSPRRKHRSSRHENDANASGDSDIAEIKTSVSETKKRSQNRLGDVNTLCSKPRRKDSGPTETKSPFAKNLKCPASPAYCVKRHKGVPPESRFWGRRPLLGFWVGAPVTQAPDGWCDSHPREGAPRTQTSQKPSAAANTSETRPNRCTVLGSAPIEICRVSGSAPEPDFRQVRVLHA